MIKKTLKLDGKQFHNTKQFKAKRPSDYWLLFIKQHILTKQPWRLKAFHLFALIPILLFLFFYSITGLSFAMFFVALICMLIVRGILRYGRNANAAFVPINIFVELAKFIIFTKGDISKNVIELRLNTGKITTAKNSLNPATIGLQNTSKIKYKPYQMERFYSQFKFKDGSICMLSFHQVLLRVSNTRRRSSGKIKTKIKYKHKLFYQLSLKLKTSDYSIIHSSSTKHFDINVKSSDKYHLVKVKFKEKITEIPSKINAANKDQISIYTEMLTYLIDKKVIRPNGNQKLIH